MVGPAFLPLRYRLPFYWLFRLLPHPFNPAFPRRLLRFSYALYLFFPLPFCSLPLSPSGRGLG